MTNFGFHASHEEFAPGALLDAARSAEEAGFELGMCSDHFAPWSHNQGHSGFAWAWLQAALASLPFGVMTLRRFAGLGLGEIYPHRGGKGRRDFIEDFGEGVSPALAKDGA